MLIHFHDGIMENEIKFFFSFVFFFIFAFGGMVYITSHSGKFFKKKKKFRENLKIQCNFIIFVLTMKMLSPTQTKNRHTMKIYCISMQCKISLSFYDTETRVKTDKIETSEKFKLTYPSVVDSYDRTQNTTPFQKYRFHFS